jgi:hypothetical protein
MDFENEVEYSVRAAGTRTTSQVFDDLPPIFKIGRIRESVIKRIRRSLKINSIFRQTDVITGPGVEGIWRMATELELLQ